jgi:uncharacterized membrane protein YidH (DUF202 family)
MVAFILIALCCLAYAFMKYYSRKEPAVRRSFKIASFCALIFLTSLTVIVLFYGTFPVWLNVLVYLGLFVNVALSLKTISNSIKN